MNYETMMARLNGMNNFGKKIGMRLVEISEGRAVIEKPVLESDLNPIGSPHGGVYFTIADAVGGAAVASLGIQCVTVNGSYNYLHAAKLGQTLRGTARLISRGRKVFVSEVEIRVDDGTLIGTANFTLYKIGLNPEGEAEAAKKAASEHN